MTVNDYIAAAAGAAKSAMTAGHTAPDAFKFAGALFALVAPSPSPQPAAIAQASTSVIAPQGLAGRLGAAPPSSPGAFPLARNQGA